MKRLTHEMRYDGATAAAVYEMLGTPAFREAVCSDQGFDQHTVSIGATGSGMRVEIDQRRPADVVPSFARKFVGGEINVVQQEEWSGPTQATVRVTIPGKPGSMSGTVELREDDAGTTEAVSMDIKVSIPPVSGRLEDLIASMLLKALRSENAVGRRWLAGDRA